MNVRVFVFIVFLMNIIQGIYTPIIDDEAYYWLWSTKLDFGYFDHPPMIALWVKMSDFIFNNEIGARFFTIFFNTIAALIYWKLADPKSKKEQLIFSIIYFSLILVQIFSFVSTPDAPLLFFTIAYLASLKAYLKKDSILNTLLLGSCFAGLMYSKYHGILVLAFTLLPIIGFWIKKPTFYVATFWSLVLYSPHFVWLFQNDFPPVAYHFVDRSAEQKFSLLQPLVYIVTAALAGVGLLVFYIAHAIKSVNQKNLFQKSVFWLVIGPFLFFLISTIKDTTQAQWLLVSYVGLGLILYWYFIKLDKLKWFYYLGVTNIILIVIARIVIMIPSISPLYETKLFGERAGELTSTEVVAFEKYQEASIFQFYNQDRQGIVYRTLGNRNSQFSLWDTESLLENEFTYVSPWLHSEVSFEGIKKKEYFVTSFKGIVPIQKVEGDFSLINNEEVDNQIIDIVQGSSNSIAIQISELDSELLKSNQVKLDLYCTKETQFNIIEQLEIPMDQMILNDNQIQLNFNWSTNLEPGEYSLYIGATPAG